MAEPLFDKQGSAVICSICDEQLEKGMAYVVGYAVGGRMRYRWSCSCHPADGPNLVLGSLGCACAHLLHEKDQESYEELMAVIFQEVLKHEGESHRN